MNKIKLMVFLSLVAALVLPACMTTAGNNNQNNAGIPSTGTRNCVSGHLKNIYNFSVVDGQGNELGTVDHIVVLRDAALAAAEISGPNNSGPGATPQPTGTPAPMGRNTLPQISYLGVNLNDQPDSTGNARLVPFKAFSGLSENPAANDGGKNSAAAKSSAGSCSLTLTVDPALLAQVPPADLVNATNADWTGELNAFWEGQGVTAPATSSNGAELGAPVVLRKDFSGVAALNANRNQLGKVVDFIIDPKSGDLRYGILEAGGFIGIGSKYLPVPMGHAQWTSPGTGGSGTIVININQEDWAKAPAFDKPEQIDPTVSGWDQEISGFWNSVRSP